MEQNGGAPGINGMTVQELGLYLKEHWSEVQAELEAETDQPQPVRWVEIAKPDGGVRLLEGFHRYSTAFRQLILLTYTNTCAIL